MPSAPGGGGWQTGDRHSGAGRPCVTPCSLRPPRAMTGACCPHAATQFQKESMFLPIWYKDLQRDRTSTLTLDIPFYILLLRTGYGIGCQGVKAGFAVLLLRDCLILPLQRSGLALPRGRATPTRATPTRATPLPPGGLSSPAQSWGFPPF